MVALSEKQRRWLLLILSAAAFLPVLFFSPERGDEPPPHVFPHYVTDAVDLSVMPSAVDRVRILVNRRYRSDQFLWYVGFLVWLPLVVGLLSICLFEATHDEIKSHYGLMVAAAAIAVSVAVAALWRWSFLSLALAAAITAVVGVVGRRLFKHREEPAAAGWDRLVLLHMITVAVLAISGSVVSVSTHLLLTRYAGYAPSTDRFAAVAAEFDESMDVDAPPYVRDDAAWRIEQLPSINALGWKMTLFGLNRATAILFVLTILAYMNVWAIVIHHHHRLHGSRDWICERCGAKNRGNLRCKGKVCTADRGYPRWRPFRLAFAPAVYLAAGVAFAVIFYSDYAAAAAKQNVMATYADYLVADSDREEKLEKYFTKQRWSQSTEQEILSVASQRSGDALQLAESIAKARARFWPSAVIAHETPRVKQMDPSVARRDQSTENPGFETEFAVDPIMSFHDMAYFSFVSFTTTGYGDVRPVSDKLRFWTIIENITEILFVAFFIGVAVDD